MSGSGGQFERFAVTRHLKFLPHGFPHEYDNILTCHFTSIGAVSVNALLKSSVPIKNERQMLSALNVDLKVLGSITLPVSCSKVLDFTKLTITKTTKNPPR